MQAQSDHAHFLSPTVALVTFTRVLLRLQVFRVSEEQDSERKAEPAQSQAADRFEQRIQQNRQQHKEEMKVRLALLSSDRHP